MPEPLEAWCRQREGGGPHVQTTGDGEEAIGETGEGRCAAGRSQRHVPLQHGSVWWHTTTEKLAPQAGVAYDKSTHVRTSHG